MTSKQAPKPNAQAETFRTLLARAVETEEMGEQLTAMGLPPTYENAVCLAALRKAAGGDLSAYRLIGMCWRSIRKPRKRDPSSPVSWAN